MSWHHPIYHLPFRIIFCLSSIGPLPKWLLEFRNKPSIFVACKFGAAHCRPWQMKRKKIGLICRPEKTNPGDGVLVDHIVSAQPALIPQISGFITIHRFWGCTTFMDHVSEYVYVHLMRDLSLLWNAAWPKRNWKKLWHKPGKPSNTTNTTIAGLLTMVSLIPLFKKIKI